MATKLNNRVRANPPPVETNNDLDLYDVKQDDIHNVRMKEIINKIEDKVFDGPVKMHQIFKNFDRDGDGFVSYADFEERL